MRELDFSLFSKRMKKKSSFALSTKRRKGPKRALSLLARSNPFARFAPARPAPRRENSLAFSAKKRERLFPTAKRSFPENDPATTVRIFAPNFSPIARLAAGGFFPRFFSIGAAPISSDAVANRRKARECSRRLSRKIAPSPRLPESALFLFRKLRREKFSCRQSGFRSIFHSKPSLFSHAQERNFQKLRDRKRSGKEFFPPIFSLRTIWRSFFAPRRKPRFLRDGARRRPLAEACSLERAICLSRSNFFALRRAPVPSAPRRRLFPRKILGSKIRSPGKIFSLRRIYRTLCREKANFSPPLPLSTREFFPKRFFLRPRSCPDDPYFRALDGKSLRKIVRELARSDRCRHSDEREKDPFVSDAPNRGRKKFGLLSRSRKKRSFLFRRREESKRRFSGAVDNRTEAPSAAGRIFSLAPIPRPALPAARVSSEYSSIRPLLWEALSREAKLGKSEPLAAAANLSRPLRR